MTQLLNQPQLPYNGTSGHSGTDTSKERALDADKSGKTLKRQARLLALLESKQDEGLTWKEFSEISKLHHGTASGILSVLHKTGKIARLKQSRNRCKVYVSLSWIQGRPTEQQGVQKCCPHCGGNL